MIYRDPFFYETFRDFIRDTYPHRLEEFQKDRKLFVCCSVMYTQCHPGGSRVLLDICNEWLAFRLKRYFE